MAFDLPGTPMSVPKMSVGCVAPDGGHSYKVARRHSICSCLRDFVVKIFVMGRKSANGSARLQERNDFADARSRISRSSIPELIELLESPSLRTRFLAEMCLRDATGT